MRSSPIRRAAELTPAVKEALESLMGGALGENESVTVTAYQPHEAPTGEAREAVYHRLLAQVSEISARGKELPESEINSLVD